MTQSDTQELLLFIALCVITAACVLHRSGWRLSPGEGRGRVVLNRCSGREVRQGCSNPDPV